MTLFALSLFMVFLFASSAQAQSMFVAENPEGKDWALRWIDFLFSGKGLGDSAISTSNSIQAALGTALSYYSMAILVLAGFLLLYHLIFMVAETAHTGRVMGRANQIWAPIRLVFAISMLVPITAGGSGGTDTSRITGYNTAQYIAIQIGKWGSGLAGNVWKHFIDVVGQNQQTGVCNNYDLLGASAVTSAPSCIKIVTPALDMVSTLMAMEGCAYLVNYYMGTAPNNKNIPKTAHVVPFLGPSNTSWGSRLMRPSQYFQAGKKYGLGLEGAKKNYKQDYIIQNLCGSYEIPVKKTYTYSAVYDAYLESFEQLINDASSALTERTTVTTSYGNTIMSNLIDSVIRNNPYEDDSESEDEVREPEVIDLDVYVNKIQTIATDFQMKIQNQIPRLIKGADEAFQENLVSQMSLTGPYVTTGWLTAPVWFLQITSIVGDRLGVLEGSIPSLSMPMLATAGHSGAKGDPLDAARKAYKEFLSHLDDGMAQAMAAEDGLSTGYVDVEKASGHMALESVSRSMLRVLDSILVGKGLTNADGTLAMRFGISQNPVLEIASLGYKYLQAGSTALVMGGGLISGGKLSGATVGAAADAIADIVAGGFSGFVGGVLITSSFFLFLVGLTLAFIIPLYPFYRFFFGAVKWVVTLFEAVVMAPLFALAHINPYGEGLAGQYGKYGYSVAMQLLLRPVLMIFGLIVGYLLFTATLFFLNDIFYFATQSVFTQQNEVIAIIAKLVYSIIYCVLAVILANQCFRTIGLFPDVALSWLGMAHAIEEKTGDSGSPPPPPPAPSGPMGGSFTGHMTSSSTTRIVKDETLRIEKKKDSLSSFERVRSLSMPEQAGLPHATEEKTGDFGGSPLPPAAAAAAPSGFMGGSFMSHTTSSSSTKTVKEETLRREKKKDPSDTLEKNRFLLMPDQD
ncbi:MAG: DotA/TraY family protein [Alphaproteobacteria bacterium]|nr:DotA/TraY family protein [Alphaproteobacteria bacterium]